MGSGLGWVGGGRVGGGGVNINVDVTKAEFLSAS